MVEKLNIALFEKQANFETEEAALFANDFVDVVETATVEIDPDIEAQNRGGGRFGNHPRTVGKYGINIVLPVNMYSRGTAGDPDFVRLMECAGWTRRADDTYIKMRPTSEIIHAGTLWGYVGGPGTNKSLLHKFGNIVGSLGFTIETAKAARMTFTGMGRVVDLPAVATQPSVDDYRERVSAPAFLSATCTINGVSYKPVSIEIVDNQPVENNLDATHEYGGGDTEFTDRNIEFTAVVYAKAIAAQIPHTNMHTQTAGSFDLRWGSTYAPYDLRIYSSSCRFHNVKPGNNNGVTTWEVQGYFDNNDVEVWCYNGNTSSYSSSSFSNSSDSNSSSSGSVSVSSASTSSTSSLSL